MVGVTTSTAPAGSDLTRSHGRSRPAGQGREDAGAVGRLRPGASRTLAGRHGLAARTLSEHVTLLRSPGLVTARRDRDHMRSRMNPLGAALVTGIRGDGDRGKPTRTVAATHRGRGRSACSTPPNWLRSYRWWCPVGKPCGRGADLLVGGRAPPSAQAALLTSGYDHLDLLGYAAGIGLAVAAVAAFRSGSFHRA